MKQLTNLCVSCGARGSPLSQKQLWEVYKELIQFHPDVQFHPVWVTTTGDKDHKTSLRYMENSNFFTKEIDDMLLAGDFRISIHSAKDLPEPLANDLSLIALTSGLDPSDSLVIGPTFTGKGKIATSSLRREKTIRDLYPEAAIVDIRGTIAERLAYIERGEIEGLVMAECALLRLCLDNIERIKLPGPYAKHQGQLAVIARGEDAEMKELFSCIDCRKI